METTAKTVNFNRAIILILPIIRTGFFLQKWTFCIYQSIPYSLNLVPDLALIHTYLHAPILCMKIFPREQGQGLNEG